LGTEGEYRRGSVRGKVILGGERDFAGTKCGNGAGASTAGTASSLRESVAKGPNTATIRATTTPTAAADLAGRRDTGAVAPTLPFGGPEAISTLYPQRRQNEAANGSDCAQRGQLKDGPTGEFL
jgi:hypothetical protein